MVSDIQARKRKTRQRRTAQLFSVFALSGFGFATYWAGLLHANKAEADQARAWVLCALLASISVITLLVTIKKIIRLSLTPIIEKTPALPSGDRTSQSDQATQSHFENRIEHAPIALFSLKRDKPVQALNTNARRLLAPGRVLEKDLLLSTLQSLKPQGRALIEFETERGIERALASSNQIIVQGETEQLIALMPVESELQLEAQNAWLKLLRVLIHEINNSLTPVASLSRTVSEELTNHQHLFTPDLSQVQVANTYQDLQSALEAIHRRAAGLSDFVNHTRDLTNLAPAKPKRVLLTTLFSQLESLFAPDWKKRGGTLTFTCDPDNIEVIVDPLQLEQALINLIQNAYDATDDIVQASLHIHAKLTHGARLSIEVIDNGKGINEEHLPHIFTPFFSTKEKGSGIGLALTRQLIQNNNGTVRYAQSVGGGAKFIITL
ncbi:sensor histidine kinase [Undibacterium flavidum]|uniref:histidine kinase n=1 Tax=Undibacterium flavidum TaxID=2762297 RepID=A0ABR6YC14_9BURK|nr:sensor histidine kinase [Undibacterium flavidum]MBC3874014.1 sensor histidine kinase [Undibacterium flavidum]